MIALSQIFAQQPRNSPNSVSIPYCQKAPKNGELTGLFQCQFQGSKKDVFVGNVQAGGPGTIPFGKNALVQPPGSCPANPGGPIADGQQLVDTVQTPNVPGNGDGNQASPAPAPSPPPTPGKKSPSPAPAQNPNAPPAGKAADGKAAQQQNAEFATLTPQSECNSKQRQRVHLQPHRLLTTFLYMQPVKPVASKMRLPSA